MYIHGISHCTVFFTVQLNNCTTYGTQCVSLANEDLVYWLIGI